MWRDFSVSRQIRRRKFELSRQVAALMTCGGGTHTRGRDQIKLWCWRGGVRFHYNPKWRWLGFGVCLCACACQCACVCMSVCPASSGAATIYRERQSTLSETRRPTHQPMNNIWTFRALFPPLQINKRLISPLLSGRSLLLLLPTALFKTDSAEQRDDAKRHSTPLGSSANEIGRAPPSPRPYTRKRLSGFGLNPRKGQVPMPRGSSHARPRPKYSPHQYPVEQPRIYTPLCTDTAKAL